MPKLVIIIPTFLVIFILLLTAVRPFDKEQELQEKSTRLAELNKELDIGKGDKNIDLESNNDREEIKKTRNSLTR